MLRLKHLKGSTKRKKEGWRAPGERRTGTGEGRGMERWRGRKGEEMEKER